MIFYVIRHKLSGRLMPGVPAKQRAGATHVELTDNAPPRLFTKRRYAAAALQHWLEGKKTVHVSNGPWEDCGDVVEKVTPQANRVADDMEIVPAKLEVIDEC